MLLGVVGLVLIIPFLVVGSFQLRSTQEGVDAAEQVQASASRLAILVQLRPALNDELLSTAFATEEVALVTQFPIENLLPSFDGALAIEEAQAAVDELVELLGDEQLEQEIAETRSRIFGGVDDPRSVATIYNQVSLGVAARLEREFVALNSAAGETDSTSVSQAAQLAAGAAELQRATVQLGGTWTALEASMFVRPATEDVPGLAQAILLYSEQATLFESLAPTGGPIREAWDDIRRSEEVPRLFDQYQTTADRFTMEGLDANISPGGELSADQLPEVLSLAARIQSVLSDADVLNDKLAVLADTTLGELSASAQNSLETANQQRRITILSLIAASIFVALTIALAVGFISRPIRRLAEAANRMSLGDLDVEVPEEGPSETRVGAKAINEALASLRHVEAQAIALAEQRLNDPVLDDAAPGALGQSLQIAVTRLADSLSERDEISTKLEYEAGHDSLTKLANRRTLFDHLSKGRSDGDMFALLFLDLDGFKLLNDTHGHHVGDSVLRVIAERIQRSVRDGAVAARLGGDEFVLATEGLKSSDDAIEIAERLYDDLIKPIELAELTVVPKMSIGIAMSSDSRTPMQMLRDADLALYRSKAENERPIVLCDDELRREADRRTELEQSIRHGLAHDEFIVHFQTIVSAGEESGVGTEALVRWQRDGEVLTYPDQFIPIAEMSDLIIDLDCWVLDRVAREIAAGSFPDDVGVAVNISGRHLSSGKLAGHVSSVIKTHQIDPHRLVIEVTETALLEDFETAAEDLASLRSLGVAVALDDFGTGFMSLAYLRSLPVDILKIDRSFVDEVETTEGGSFVQLIIDTGHLLELSIVAEGVETRRQADLLTAMGVDVLQGYWFGRPEPLGKKQRCVSVVDAGTSAAS